MQLNSDIVRTIDQMAKQTINISIIPGGFFLMMICLCLVFLLCQVIAHCFFDVKNRKVISNNLGVCWGAWFFVMTSSVFFASIIAQHIFTSLDIAKELNVTLADVTLRGHMANALIAKLLGFLMCWIIIIPLSFHITRLQLRKKVRRSAATGGYADNSYPSPFTAVQGPQGLS